MTAEEIKLLEKEVNKARFILTQKAGDLHDLVEDRLPAAFEEIPVLADETYQACKKWNELNKQLAIEKQQL